MPPDPAALQELADALDEAHKLYLSALQARSRGEITQTIGGSARSLSPACGAVPKIRPLIIPDKGK